MSIEQIVVKKLTEHFQPEFLEVVNESYMHSVPPNSETHFKAVIVSKLFENLRPVKRHQQVYAVLADELAGGVHALALHTHTPLEWQSIGKAPDSPNCLGGGK